MEPEINKIDWQTWNVFSRYRIKTESTATYFSLHTGLCLASLLQRTQLFATTWVSTCAVPSLCPSFSLYSANCTLMCGCCEQWVWAWGQAGLLGGAEPSLWWHRLATGWTGPGHMWAMGWTRLPQGNMHMLITQVCFICGSSNILTGSPASMHVGNKYVGAGLVSWGDTVQPPSRTGGKEATCMKVQEIVAQVHCCQQLGKGEKKKKEKQSQQEWDWNGEYADRKKKHFLLMVEVVPFRSSVFVLFSYWSLEFSGHQSIHKVLPHFLPVYVSAVSCPQRRKKFETKW